MVATIDELELQLRVGHGVAIVVEGERYEDDAWFYGQWFNGLAPQVTFFPQDGWERVTEAVSELRSRDTGIPVYGIIDRDFTEEAALDADFATMGVLRTPRYTIENYLLDPGGWARVLAFIFRLQGHAPNGWDDIDTVRSHIEEAYRDCLKLAAHNQVIKYGCTMYPELAACTPKPQRRYQSHPDALGHATDIVAKLRAWGKTLSASKDLGDLFAEIVRTLEKGSPSDWKKHVSGKHVLSVLHRQFPPLRHAGQFPLGHYLNLYLEKCPDPPQDLQVLVSRILYDASR